MIALAAGVGMLRPTAGGAPPVEALYWSPSDRHANIALSSGNSVASISVGGGWYMVRSVVSHNSGKRYAEAKYLSGVGWDGIVGVANASANLSGNVGAGSDSRGIQARTSAGVSNMQGVSGSVTPAVADNYARIALDFDAGHGWIGNSTVWAGGGDPLANASPTFTFTPGTTLFLACSLYQSAGVASMSLQTASPDFSGVLLSGYGPWEA